MGSAVAALACNNSRTPCKRSRKKGQAPPNACGGAPPATTRKNDASAGTVKGLGFRVSGSGFKDAQCITTLGTDTQLSSTASPLREEEEGEARTAVDAYVYVFCARRPATASIGRLATAAEALPPPTRLGREPQEHHPRLLSPPLALAPTPSPLRLPVSPLLPCAPAYMALQRHAVSSPCQGGRPTPGPAAACPPPRSHAAAAQPQSSSSSRLLLRSTPPSLEAAPLSPALSPHPDAVRRRMEADAV